jgi:hypothetical protein
MKKASLLEDCPHWTICHIVMVKGLKSVGASVAMARPKLERL